MHGPGRRSGVGRDGRTIDAGPAPSDAPLDAGEARPRRGPCVTFARDRRPPRRARELLSAAVGAVLLVLALVLPVLGAPPGPTKLWHPDVAPRAADSATPVTFTITYRNAHALPPDYVRGVVGGQAYPMSGAGTDWKAGVGCTCAP